MCGYRVLARNPSTIFKHIFYFAPIGERNILNNGSVSVCVCVCLSTIISSELQVRSSPIFCACTYGRGSVLLWRRSDMYFRFYGWRHVCSWTKVARRRRPAESQRTRSLGLGYNLCMVIPVAGRKTHGTTFRALKITSQVVTLGAESAVYGCLVLYGSETWSL